MAPRKSKAAATAGTDPVAAKDAPATTEESDAQVAKAVKAAEDEAHRGSTEVFDKANELGYIGTVSEEAIRNAEYADLSNDAGYMGGPPKGEIVAE